MSTFKVFYKILFQNKDVKGYLHSTQLIKYIKEDCTVHTRTIKNNSNSTRYWILKSIEQPCCTWSDSINFQPHKTYLPIGKNEYSISYWTNQRQCKKLRKNSLFTSFEMLHFQNLVILGSPNINIDQSEMVLGGKESSFF